MNLVHALAISLTAVLLVCTARAADRGEFCQNLAALESHIVDGSIALNDAQNYTLAGSTSACECSAPDESDKSFTIDCALEESYPGADEPTVFFERMSFELKEGKYSLRETSWGRDYDSFEQGRKFAIVREEFYFAGGVLEGCKANACTSCEICEDRKSVAVDCSHGDEWGELTACDDGYTGSFVNTFEFGTITAEEGVEEAPPPDSAAGDDSDDRDRDAFCRSLTDLESHMLESFEEWNGLTYTSSFDCACSDLDTDVDSFQVDCTMEGGDGWITFESSEEMVFELNQDKYELSRTSWGYEDSDEFDGEEEESFVLENGVVVGCEANGCTSCDVCPGTTYIAVNCTNRDEFYSHECGDGYTGSFSHTFNFGVIRPTVSVTDGADAAATDQETPAAEDATGTEQSEVTTETGDAVAAGPAGGAGNEGGESDPSDPGGVGVASAALSSRKMSRMVASALVVATAGFLVLVV